MNLVNRILVVLLLIGLVVASCASIFVILFARTAIAATLQPTLSAVSDAGLNVTQLLCVGIAILIFAVSILLLYLELIPSGKARMRLKSIQGVEVMLSADAITAQLEYALDALADVLRVTPHVARGKGEAVDVLVELVTTTNVDIKRKTEEVMEVTRNVIEGGLGLRVGKVQVKIDQMKAPKKPTAAGPPKLELPPLAPRAEGSESTKT